MARKYARVMAARFDAMREHALLRPFARYLAHPALWSLHRRSVALAVAVGMFGGLIPGPLQMLTAGILAVLLRCNFPIALVTTLYSNPLTIVPLYLAAYKLGSWATGMSGHTTLPPLPHFDWSRVADSTRALMQWAISLGEPLLVGLPLLAALLALLGYAVVRVGWNCSIRRQWSRRRAARLRPSA